VKRSDWRSVLGLLIFTAQAFATSNGLPIRSTGAAIDGGQNCTQCHNLLAPPVNQGPGRVIINVNSYTPGVKQSFTVQVTDNQAVRWGFQVTARLASDETREAGTFTPTDTVRVLCDPVGEAPCNGTREFATHRTTSTTGGAAGTRTFVVEWTPPGRDVGQVTFYAAGLAGDNDGTAIGDHTYTASFRASSAGCSLRFPPVVTRVTNGASFQPPISPNSLISIFGFSFTNAGDTYQALTGDLVAGKLPTDLSCGAVEIGGRRAAMYYTQTDQINAEAPDLTGSGPFQTTVILNPGGPNELRSSSLVTLTQPLAPAFFIFDGTTSIKGRNASNGNNILADPARIPGAVFAKPGDFIVLYATGFGPTTPAFATGEFSAGLARTQQAVAVTIGGTTLSSDDVLYAGLSSDAPGFYQINVKVPQSAPDGDISVTARIGSVQTPAGTIPVKR